MPWDKELDQPDAVALARQNPKPSLALGRWFQEQMKKAFETLYSGELWEYTYPQKKKRIAIQHIRAADGSRKPDNWEALSAYELLMLRAYELLAVEKNRLWVCENPNCKKKFVATKQGGTRFHSPTCSAYVRIRRSRGKAV